MKVFLAWQADTPVRIGRQFLRDALREAFEQLKLSATVVEAERLSRQEGTGEDGDLARQQIRSLLAQIDTAAAFIADVTPLGQSMPSLEGAAGSVVRKFTDPDVAFETGYAWHALGQRKLVLVFNAHFGWHDDLSADVRARGEAIAFTLVPNASRPEIEAERRKFVNRLVSVLRQSINTAPGAAPGAPATAGAAPASRAAYYRPGEVLARSGRPGPAEIGYSYAGDSLCYLRLIPLPALATPLPVARLRKVIERAPLLSRQTEGALSASNDHGAIAFEPSWPPSRGPGNLASSTQLFINGELWSISHALISHERGERPEWIRLPFVSALIFERVFYDQLRALMAFALEQLTLSAPWEVECGIAGSRGVHLWVSGQETLGPIAHGDVIVRRAVKTASAAELDEILLEFFNLLYVAAGSERSPALHGFPPDRPYQAITAIPERKQ